MNLRTTVILAILAAAGAAALWLLGPEGPKADPKANAPTPARATQKLLDPAPDANTITRIEWERAGRPKLVFERSPLASDATRMDDWRLVEPVACAGENNLINALVTAMIQLESRGSFEPGTKGAPTATSAGLEPPQAVFTYSTKSGETARIEIGRQPQLSNETWVRVGGKATFHLATRDLAQDLKRELKDYRGKMLLKVKAADVTRLRITENGRTSVFSRPLDGAWTLDEPVAAKAEKQPLDELVAKVVSLRAMEFIEDAPATLEPYGFDPAHVKIELTHERRPPPRPPTADPAASAPSTAPAPPETVTLVIGEFADRNRTKRYVKLGDQPFVASVMQVNVDPLIPDLNKIRNPLVTAADTSTLAEFTHTVGDESVTLTNEGGSWRGSGALTELDPAAVVELITAFADLRALEFNDRPGDLAEFGLDKPRATLRARQKDNGAVITLHVGRLSESKRNAFVALEGVPTVFLVSAEQAERLVVPPLSLRSRTIFSFDPQQLERIELTRSGTAYLAVKQASGWTLMEPLDCSIDRVSITQMSNDLARLRAKRVVATGGDGEAYGLTSPVASFVFGAKSPTTAPATSSPASAEVTPLTTHRLVLGFKDNVAYCRKDDEPYIYEIDSSVYLSLIGELIDRRLFSFTADEVVAFAVAVQGNDRPFAIRRGDDGVWTYVPDPQGEKISSKKVNEYLAELAETRVDAYLAYREGDLAAQGLGPEAPVRITIRLKSAKELHLVLAEPSVAELPRKGAWVEEGRVFLLKQTDSEKLLRALDYYGAPDEPATPPQPEGMPGLPPGIGPG